MSEPNRKPNQTNPGSYSPKKPEIVDMLKQAEMDDGDINMSANQTAGGTSGIDYNFEFSPLLLSQYYRNR